MASIAVNNGLQRIGVQASQATGTGVTYDVARHIRTMSVDGTADPNPQPSAFAAAHTALNDGATDPTSMFDQALVTPTRTTQTISHLTVIGTGDANFRINRIALHDDTITNVTQSSATLVCGVDGQSLTKTSDFSMTPTLSLAYTSV